VAGLLDGARAARLTRAARTQTAGLLPIAGRAGRASASPCRDL